MPDPSSCTYPVFCPTTSSCSDCKEIKHLDAKIRRLNTLARLRVPFTQRRRTILLKERSLIFGRINAARDPISSKLPVEVTRMIFEAYVGLHPMEAVTSRVLQADLETRYSSYEGWCNFETFEPAAYLRLGAVCQTWREIAWENSRLWNTLHITIDALFSGPATVNDEVPQLLAEWLKRSEPHLLDIRFVNPHYHHLVGDSLVDRTATIIFQQLLTCLPRWRNVHFEVDYLNALLHAEEEESTSRQLPESFRRLALNGPNSGATPGHARVPSKAILSFHLWWSLTRLDLFDVHIETALAAIQLLSVMPSQTSIVHLGLAMIRPQDFESTELEISDIGTRLKSLRSLSLSQSGQSLAPILDRLLTPSLESVAWLYHDTPQDGELEAFIDFIHRSGCSIQSFFAVGLEKVDDSDDDDSVVIRLFGALPDLKELSMGAEESGMFPSVIPCLSQKLSSFLGETLLPRLTRFFCQHKLLDGTDLHDYLPVIIGLFIDDLFIVDDKVNPSQDLPQTLPPPERSILQDVTVIFSQEMMEPQNQYRKVRRPPLVLTSRYRSLLLKLLQQYGIHITLKERRGTKELLTIFDPSTFRS